MTALPNDPQISPKELIAFAKELFKEEIIELELKNIRLDLYSIKQLNALIRLIKEARVTKLTLEDNNLGTKLSLRYWKILCNGLRGSAVETLKIDQNELDKFSYKHWKTLESLIGDDGLKQLKLLSLQHNNLVGLEENCFLALKRLAHKATACHLAENNWINNFKRWSDLISKESVPSKESTAPNIPTIVVTPPNRYRFPPRSLANSEDELDLSIDSKLPTP